MKRNLAIGLVATLLTISAFALPSNSWNPLQSGSQPTAPQLTLVEETPDHLVLRWDISGYYLTDLQTPKGSFQRIALDDRSGFNAAIGEPELPILTALIAVPPGRSPKGSVLQTDWVSIGSHRLPAKQIPTRDEDQPALPYQLSESAYGSNKILPLSPVSITSVQGWAGVPVAGVGVIPARYQPLTGMLELAKSITVRIDFAPGGRLDIETPHKQSASRQKVLNAALANPPRDPQPLDADINEPVRMLFIMKQEALETAQPLIDYHHQTGLRSDTWLVEDGVTAEQVKDRIREYYDEGLEYVFIIGDSYWRLPDVPMNHWDPGDPGVDDDPSDAWSDSWYACMDEPDQGGYDDHLPDLAIGRLTYDNNQLDQLEVQVTKLRHYLEWSFENNDDSDWPSRALLVAHSIAEYRNCKTAVRDYKYSLPHPEFISAFGGVNGNGANNQTILDNVNDTHAGLFNYRGHGSRTGWGIWDGSHSFGATQVCEMDNVNSPFVLILSACLNGDIATIESDCLAESFQKWESGASVCAYGGTQTTFTEGNTYFDIALFRAFFDDGIYTIGDAAAQCVTDMVIHFDAQEGPDGYTIIGRLNARAYIWLGDPALELRDQAPESLLVQLQDPIIPGQQEFEVTISKAGQPVSGAQFCLRTEDDAIYIASTTNEDGVATIEFEEPLADGVRFLWGATERNSFPVYGELVVAGGSGAISGQVTELANGNPIDSVWINLLPFELDAYTDSAGNYLFDGIPAMPCRLSVSAPSFLPQSRDVVVADSQTTIADFAMTFAQLELDSAEVRSHIERDEQYVRPITIRNAGDGTLEWSGFITVRSDLQPYELRTSLDMSAKLADDRLYGVEFIGDRFYVAGGNRGGDPNYIYVLDRDGSQISSFRQPVGSAGVGIRDLAWDGEYLYGSSNDATIFRFTTEGVSDSSIIGHYRPNLALTCDEEGCLWVGKDQEPLIKLDQQGSVLDQIQTGYNVRGLAYYPEDPEGFYIQMLVEGDGEYAVALYKANPATGEVRFAADLTQEFDETPGYGLTSSSSYESNQWSLIGMVERGGVKYIKVWELGSCSGWISLDPDRGTVAPNDETELDLSLDATGLGDGQKLSAILTLDNNGRTPRVEVPIEVLVGTVSIVESDRDRLPSRFSLEPAFPNPFNARAIVEIDLPSATRLKIVLCDIQGRKVKDFGTANYDAGRQQLKLQMEELPTGIYLLKVNAYGQSRAVKMVLLR